MHIQALILVGLNILPHNSGMSQVLTSPGTTTAIAGAGCCDTGVEQLISITSTSAFPTANLKT